MKLTPMMQQYKSFKEQYPDKIVLFRMGDFYETFGEDARRTAKVLNITLTTRDKKSDPTPLAGFPYHALDQYLPKIVTAGESAVIVEQLEDPKQAKGIVKRGVVRVITPGTLDGDHASAVKNSYLLAITTNKKRAGIAIMDLSTGEFQATETSDDTDAINNQISSFDPSELLLIDGEKSSAKLNLNIPIQLIDKLIAKTSESESIIKKFYKIKNLQSLGLEGKTAAVGAIAMVLHYIEDTQKMNPDHIGLPELFNPAGTMILDMATIRNLDLVANSYTGSIKDSLFATLDETETPMGKRRLYSWILNPLLDLEKINDRLDVVEDLFESPEVLATVREKLSNISDIDRIIGKIGLNRANGRDFKSLQESIENAVSLYAEIKASKKINKSFSFNELLEKSKNESKVESLTEFAKQIDEIISESPPLAIQEGGVIKTGHNSEIDDLRDIRGNSKQWLEEFITQEKEKTGIPSMKIGYNRVFGYYIDVTKVHQDKVPDSYIRKQTLVNSERYITEELKEKEDIILNAEGKLSDLEYKLFQQFRDDSLIHLENLKSLGSQIARLDVLASFAQISRTNDYAKPLLHAFGKKERILKIQNGRHPVIEQLSQEPFISNDTQLSGSGKRMAIITGPNMSGKSTYIRQVAILTLMAQIGCYVSADSLEMSLVDRVFSRVGAADDLTQGRSTFMVEMEETANILNNATEDSLVILDEVGRGTSTYDGVSIAWALSEYIVKNTKARTLFATHYHELVKLEEEFPDNILNLNVYVKEDEERDEVVFMRKIVEGSADKSYGIYVAKLAGLPKSVVKRANTLLSSFENGKAEAKSSNATNDSRSLLRPGQIDFFAGGNNNLEAEKSDEKLVEINDILGELDLSETTPAKAIELLDKLQKISNKN
jgi:DNA mismatch repair protein MutS